MKPETIDGEKIAEKVISRIEGLDEKFKLHIVFAGDREASKTFIENKKEACERLGFEAEIKRFPEEVEEERVISHIERKNNDEEVDGILVQLPLPEQIDEDRVFETLDPSKDVDCLTPENLGKLLRGNAELKPCAVEGIEKILEEAEVDVKGKNVTVINNSNLIGKPLSMELTRKKATVTICHEWTEDLEKHTEKADVIVTATGEEELLEDEMIQEESIVIDAGYSYTQGELDQETHNLEKPSKISTVPGGLGPITVAITMKNLVKCHEMEVN